MRTRRRSIFDGNAMYPPLRVLVSLLCHLKSPSISPD
jgi:hypothetical protein